MSPYRFCLWGHRQGYVQVGSELDRAIWGEWRAAVGVYGHVRQARVRLGYSLREMGEHMRRLSRAAQGATFSLLDYREAVHGEDSTPVSWEVERHRFLRRLGVR